MACIYKIINTDNGLSYIGQTKHTAKKRFKQHWGAREDKSKIESSFHKALRETDEKFFLIKTIVEGDFNLPLLHELEKHYIQLYASNRPERGYNITSGGGTLSPKARTKEARAKARLKMKGQVRNKTPYKYNGTQEHRKKTILQYSKDMVLIKEWVGLKHMCRELNLRVNAVSRVLSGENKKHHNFIFQYK